MNKSIATVIALLAVAASASAQTSIYIGPKYPEPPRYHSQPERGARHHDHYRDGRQGHLIYQHRPPVQYIMPPVQYQVTPRCIDYYDQFRRVWIQC